MKIKLKVKCAVLHGILPKIPVKYVINPGSVYHQENLTNQIFFVPSSHVVLQSLTLINNFYFIEEYKTPFSLEIEMHV